MMRALAKGGATAGHKARKLSRTHKPDAMSVEERQIALRHQFGREQDFALENLDSHPLFPEIAVTNPQTKRHLRPHAAA